MTADDRREKQRLWAQSPAGLAARARASAKALAGYHSSDKTQAKARQRRNYYRRTYGLELHQVEEMRAAQGTCPICERALAPLGHRPGDSVVDHCHTTGVVRKVLCWECNVALGFLGDSPERMRRAAAYVEAHR